MRGDGTYIWSQTEAHICTQLCEGWVKCGDSGDKHTHPDACAPLYHGMGLDEGPLIHAHRGTHVCTQV